MKKARIILTSIAVLAIVGGAFAYEAAKAVIIIYTCSNQAVPALGTCVAENVSATSSVAQEGYSSVLSTTANITQGVSCTSSTPCSALLYTIIIIPE